MNEQTPFSKAVPSSCCIRPTEHITTRNQHIMVMPRLNLTALFSAAKKVKRPPIIQMIILMIDSWNWVANESDRPPFTHVYGRIPLITKT